MKNIRWSMLGLTAALSIFAVSAMAPKPAAADDVGTDAAIGAAVGSLLGSAIINSSYQPAYYNDRTVIVRDGGWHDRGYDRRGWGDQGWHRREYVDHRAWGGREQNGGGYGGGYRNHDGWQRR